MTARLQSGVDRRRGALLLGIAALVVALVTMLLGGHGAPDSPEVRGARAAGDPGSATDGPGDPPVASKGRPGAKRSVDGQPVPGGKSGAAAAPAGVATGSSGDGGSGQGPGPSGPSRADSPSAPGPATGPAPTTAPAPAPDPAPGPTREPSPGPNPLPVGVMFGVAADPHDGLDQYESVEDLEQRTGRKMAIAHRWHGFSDHHYMTEARHVANGRIPMIAWRATENDEYDPNRAARIAAGEFDDTIASAANAMKALNGRVLLMFHWEMDMYEGERQYVGTPGEYVAMWRHVHGMFQGLDVDNVEFVWIPRANSFNKDRGQLFYPGDGYVDWIGGVAVPISDTFRPFEAKFQAMHDFGHAHGKPVLVFFGIREKPDDPAWKPAYLRNVRDQILDNMPGVRAVVYYHALAPKGELFWADTTPASFEAFKDLACHPHFAVLYACEGPPAPPPTLHLGGVGDANGKSWIAYPFDVLRPGEIRVELDWTDASADLALFLRAPGETTSVATSTGPERPKTLVFSATEVGEWVIAVKVRSGATDYTLEVTRPV